MERKLSAGASGLPEASAMCCVLLVLLLLLLMLTRGPPFYPDKSHARWRMTARDVGNKTA